MNQLSKTILARVSWGVGAPDVLPPERSLVVELMLPQTFLYEPPLLGVGRLRYSLQTSFLALVN